MKLSRVEPVDFLVVDGEGLVLLHTGHAMRLSPIATAIFEFLDKPAPAHTLRNHLEEQFGEAPDGPNSLDAMLETMLAEGLLARSDDD